MKNRNLLILAGVLVLLVVISVAQKAGRNNAASQPDTDPVLAVDFANEEINRIVIGRGEDPDSTGIIIERLPDQWVLRNSWSHAGNSERVESLLTALNGLRGEFRSDSDSVLADYDLGGDDALRISLYGKDWQEIFGIELGKKPARGNGVFVRSPNSNAVFLTRRDLLGKLGIYGGPENPKPQQFLDLKVKQLDRQAIDKITMYTDGEPLALEKIFSEPVAAAGDTAAAAIDRSIWEWRITAPQTRPAAKTKCDVVLGALANVRAADIDDPDRELLDYGLWRAAKRVEVTLGDGSVFEMRFGDKRPGSDGVPAGYYMMTSDDRTIWIVREYLVDQIFKGMDDLLPDE